MRDLALNTDQMRETYAWALSEADSDGPIPSMEQARAIFNRWLAEHNRALGDALLDDLAAGLPDDVRGWVDEYRTRPEEVRCPTCGRLLDRHADWCDEPASPSSVPTEER